MSLFPFLCFLGLLCASGVLAVPKNVTIDDTFPGDAKTRLTYSPAAGWTAGNAETHGRAVPDMARVRDGTWHDTTQDSLIDQEQAYMELAFEGSGVYIYCIIANNLDPGTGVKADYTFLLDGREDGKYFHNRDGNGDPFYYSVLVYQRNDLPFGKHTLRVIPNGGPGVEGSTLLLFDNAVVTTDDGTSPPTTPKPPTTTSSSTTSTSSTTTQSTTSQSSTASHTSSSTSSESLSSTSSGDTSAIAGFATAGSGAPQPSESLGSVDPQSSKPPIGAIVGGVVGALFLALAIFFLICYRRRRRPVQQPPVEQFTPFHDDPTPLSSPEMRLNGFDSPSSSSMLLRPLRLPDSDTTSSSGPRSETPLSNFTPTPRPEKVPFGPSGNGTGSHNHSSSFSSSQNGARPLSDHGGSLTSSASRNRDSLVQNLREEVEELRRRMQLQPQMEPPPRYEEAQ